MKEATLCYVIHGNPANKVLLGYKKTGFGLGKFVGFGGKVKNGKIMAEAAVWELAKESSLQVQVDELKSLGQITFLFPHRPDWDHLVHLFLTRTWRGDPSKSDEMRPQWFNVGQIPYHLMWEDSRYFLPLALDGQEMRALFTYQSMACTSYTRCRTSNFQPRTTSTTHASSYLSLRSLLLLDSSTRPRRRRFL
jgi:ADP-ribose pyrophosphatase YjhB (NUDIX family)